MRPVVSSVTLRRQPRDRTGHTCRPSAFVSGPCPSHIVMEVEMPLSLLAGYGRGGPRLLLAPEVWSNQEPHAELSLQPQVTRGNSRHLT